MSASTSSEQPQEEATSSTFMDWTKDEKYDLYIGLKYHGYNIRAIRMRLTTRTAEEIQAAINFFVEKLSVRKSNDAKIVCSRKYKPEPQIPLAKWADLMTQTYNYQELQTECATALRIIADFEQFPLPSQAEDIDFRKIYHYIADAMEGKPLPEDPLAADILNHCVMESALMSKVFIPKNELHDILAMFSMSQGTSSRQAPRLTKDGGLAALRHIAGQQNYNPLNIPELYLKHSPSYTADGGSSF